MCAGVEVLRDRRSHLLRRGLAIAIEVPRELVRIAEELVVFLQHVGAVVEVLEPVDRGGLVRDDDAVDLLRIELVLRDAVELRYHELLDLLEVGAVRRVTVMSNTPENVIPSWLARTDWASCLS